MIPGINHLLKLVKYRVIKKLFGVPKINHRDVALGKAQDVGANIAVILVFVENLHGVQGGRNYRPESVINIRVPVLVIAHRRNKNISGKTGSASGRKRPGDIVGGEGILDVLTVEQVFKHIGNRGDHGCTKNQRTVIAYPRSSRVPRTVTLLISVKIPSSLKMTSQHRSGERLE